MDTRNYKSDFEQIKWEDAAEVAPKNTSNESDAMLFKFFMSIVGGE